MELENALNIQRMNVKAQASTKKRALELVSESCAIGMEKIDFFHALVEREKLGSTALGHGVALPHARLSKIDKPMACFFKLEQPIEYDAPDQEPVDLILGLFVPEEARDSHLQLLSQIAQLMSQESVRAALRQCQNIQEAFRIITQPFGDEALVS